MLFEIGSQEILVMLLVVVDSLFQIELGHPKGR
jgi:hypothetical protein